MARSGSGNSIRPGDVRVMPDGRRVRVLDIYSEPHPTRRLMANLMGAADGRTFVRTCAAVRQYPKINGAQGA